MRNIFLKSYSIKTLMLILLFTGLGGIFMPGLANAAFLENIENVPLDPVRNDMTAWGQRAGGHETNNQCGYGTPKYHHAQWTWISVQGDNANQNITLKDTDTTIPLQMNAVAAICDSIITYQSIISDTTLRRTQTNLSDIKARVRGTTTTLPVSGFATPITQNYAFNYNDGSGNQRRYVKYSGSMPYFDAFTVSGIQALNLSPGTYYIDVFADKRAINEYNSGAQYRCVNNGGVPVGSLNDPACPLVDDSIEATIRIVIEPAYAGTCNITKINGAPVSGPVYLNPGQSFTASFVTENTGVEPWFTRDNLDSPAVESQVILGTDNPLDATTWGPIRARITGNVYSGMVLQAGATSPEFTHTFTVPSNYTGGNFTWRLLKEPAPSIVRIGSGCSQEIRVRKNQPFLRASGGDVYSGARFGSLGETCPATASGPSDPRLNAHINTRGDYGYPTTYDSNGNITGLTAALNGQSSGQYAVFASGLIGGPAGGNNNFLGNNTYARNTDGLIRRDLLFANSSARSQYGNFNTTFNSLPCIDIASIESKAPPPDPTTSLAAVAQSTAPVEIVRLSGNRTTGSITGVRNKKIIVVDGSVTITGNITYDGASYGFNADGSPRVPFLMIIAKNGLYVNSSVSSLDGHYVSAQTGGAANAGIVDTCVNGGGGGWPSAGNYTIGGCNSKLTINGSLVGNRILWKRTFGTIGGSQEAADTSCVVNSGVNYANLASRLELCSAEYINKYPESYFGNPADTGTNTITGIPTSTTELPPIY